MAEASITLKLSPAEFDLLRAAIVAQESALTDRGQNAAITPQERRDARADATRLDDLRLKLQ